MLEAATPRDGAGLFGVKTNEQSLLRPRVGRLDAMYEFHAQHGIKAQRGYGERNKIRWRFADAEIAKKFASEFDAKLIEWKN